MGTHEAVSSGGSPWRVEVDGVEQEGTHDDLHKAQARGYRILRERPGADVRLRREEEIRLSLNLEEEEPVVDEEEEPAPTDPPAMPEGLALTQVERRETEVEYEATWDPVADADHYRWTTGRNDDPEPQGGTVPAEGVTFTAHRSLLGDQDHFFCVRAVNAAGESEARCVGFTVPGAAAEEPPGAPEGLELRVVDRTEEEVTYEATWNPPGTATAAGAEEEEEEG